MMKNLGKYLLTSGLFLPLITLAQDGTIQGILQTILELMQGLVVIAMGAAVLIFFWGIVKFIAKAGSGEEREEAKKIMGWGIIALFVMFSIWGIIILLQDTFFPGASFNNFIPGDLDEIFGQ